MLIIPKHIGMYPGMSFIIVRGKTVGSRQGSPALAISWKCLTPLCMDLYNIVGTEVVLPEWP